MDGNAVGISARITLIQESPVRSGIRGTTGWDPFSATRSCYYWIYFGTLNEAARFVSFHCLEGRKVKATMEGIRESLDNYQNEKPDDVSYLFEEFKVIED